MGHAALAEVAEPTALAVFAPMKTAGFADSYVVPNGADGGQLRSAKQLEDQGRHLGCRLLFRRICLLLNLRLLLLVQAVHLLFCAQLDMFFLLLLNLQLLLLDMLFLLLLAALNLLRWFWVCSPPRCAQRFMPPGARAGADLIFVDPQLLLLVHTVCLLSVQTFCLLFLNVVIIMLFLLALLLFLFSVV